MGWGKGKDTKPDTNPQLGVQAPPGHHCHPNPMDIQATYCPIFRFKELNRCPCPWPQMLLGRNCFITAHGSLKPPVSAQPYRAHAHQLQTHQEEPLLSPLPPLRDTWALLFRPLQGFHPLPHEGGLRKGSPGTKQRPLGQF